MRSKTTKRLLVLFVVLAVTAMFSLQVFASVWTFGNNSQSNKAFAPRGYSVNLDGTEYWLDTSGFDHDGTYSGNNNNRAYSITYSYGYEESVEIPSLPQGSYTFKAWFDKQPLGSGNSGGGNNSAANNFMAANSETYKDFMVVNTGSGYAKISTLATAINNATRSTSVADPDGHTNQWYVQFTMNIVSGTTYTFGFEQGIEANNGNTLVIYPGTTTDHQNGYIGYVSADDTAHYTYYYNHRHDVYEYPVVGSSLGTDSNNQTVYAASLYPLEHSVTATA